MNKRTLKPIRKEEYPGKKVGDEIYMDFNHSFSSGHAKYGVVSMNAEFYFCKEIENTMRELDISDVI